MPPPPPPSSSSTDSGYLGIPAMSSRLKALEEKILRQIGPIDTGTTNRTTSRNINIQPRQIPSSIKNKHFYVNLYPSFFFVSIASLNSPLSSRASSAPPTRKGVFHLPLSPLQPTTNNTRLNQKKNFFLLIIDLFL